MPAFWCVGEVARLWLIHEGWEIKAKRAYKDGRVDIPAPVDGRSYDLHDVACEEETSGSETLRRIHKWVAGESTDRRILRCESCKEPATDERPVILWWFVAEVKNRSKPIVVKIRLQHDEDRCCNLAYPVRSQLTGGTPTYWGPGFSDATRQTVGRWGWI